MQGGLQASSDGAPQGLSLAWRQCFCCSPPYHVFVLPCCVLQVSPNEFLQAVLMVTSKQYYSYGVHSIDAKETVCQTMCSFRPCCVLQVSPHEFLQAVLMASNKRFRIDQLSDPVDFLSWLLNTLHAHLTAPPVSAANAGTYGAAGANAGGASAAGAGSAPPPKKQRKGEGGKGGASSIIHECFQVTRSFPWLSKKRSILRFLVYRFWT